MAFSLSDQDERRARLTGILWTLCALLYLLPAILAVGAAEGALWLWRRIPPQRLR